MCMVASQSLSVKSTKGPPQPIAALLISTSQHPNTSLQRSAACPAAFGMPRSIISGSARTPKSISICCAIDSTAGFRSISKRFDPFCANRTAVSRPMPPAAPVNAVTLPFMSVSKLKSLYSICFPFAHMSADVPRQPHHNQLQILIRHRT